MYSKEFLESLGLDPAVFDPDCEPASAKGERCTRPVPRPAAYDAAHNAGSGD